MSNEQIITEKSISPNRVNQQKGLQVAGAIFSAIYRIYTEVQVAYL
jgi:hypothetical protein